MNLTDPRFQSPDKAREYLEAQRWPNGPVCSHCGTFGGTPLKGTAHRPGVYQCNECREQFTVTTGSVMEQSKIPLNKWLLAMHLMGASKKGYSAHQLHRTLGVTYQTAWFLAHRIREAMNDTGAGPIGGEGKIVEADETYHGRRENPKPSAQRKGRPYLKRKKPFDKRSIVALVERGGNARMFHVQTATKAEDSSGIPLAGFLIGFNTFLMLQKKGILTNNETKELVEQALLNLETHQSLTTNQQPFIEARAILEWLRANL